MEGIGIVVTDKNDNYAPGKTGADGKLTVPATADVTNSDGKITIGGTDKDGTPITLTVKVEDFESTVKYLNTLGFDWCEIDYDYMEKWIRYFRDLGYLNA